MKIESDKKIKGRVAISQIIILIVGIIAISYIAGSEIGFVSADCASDCAKQQGSTQTYINCLANCPNQNSPPTLSKSTYYQFLNNVCTQISLVPSQVNSNDYTTLAACQAQIQAQAPSSGNSPSVSPLLTSLPGLLLPGINCLNIAQLTAAQLIECSKNAAAGGTTETTNLPSGSSCTSNAQCVGGDCDFSTGSGICFGGTGGTTPSDTGVTNPPAGEKPTTQTPDIIFGKIFSSDNPILYGIAETAGHVVQGAAIALGISVLLNQMKPILESLGIPADIIDALNPALSWGWFAGESAYGLAKSLGNIPGASWLGANAAWIGVGVGLVTALLIFFLSKTNKSQETLVFSCLPWQAPTGGQYCDLCGGNGIPCNQYQCESLGQGCQLLNAQSNGQQICAWVNKQDTSYPTIQPWNDILPQSYSYSNSNAIAPPDAGVKLISSSSDGSIPPFTPLTIGIKTDIASQCKIDTSRVDNYTSMALFMDSGLYAYNHTFTLSLPSPGVANQEGIQLNGGLMTLYIRCQSPNGYSDPANFVVQFSVSNIPDTSAPVILGASLPDNTPVAYGTPYSVVSIFVNKPVSGCNWSHSDYSYSNMENSLDCSNANTLNEINSNGQFACIANLTGIKNGLTSIFYFRCNDTLGNVNIAEPPFTLHLIGTQPLVISSASPNQTTVSDATESVHVILNVQTAAGANQGQAICFYTSQNPNLYPNSYQKFANTNSYNSTQDLWLPASSYNYSLKCVDAGGNAAYSTVNFNVQTVNQPPNVVRVSHDGANLVIQTDVNATCVYDIVDCTPAFSDETPMLTTNGITHSTSWVAGRTYYIKCQNSYGIQPAPNSCSIQLSASGT